MLVIQTLITSIIRTSILPNVSGKEVVDFQHFLVFLVIVVILGELSDFAGVVLIIF